MMPSRPPSPRHFLLCRDEYTAEADMNASDVDLDESQKSSNAANSTNSPYSGNSQNPLPSNENIFSFGDVINSHLSSGRIQMTLARAKKEHGPIASGLIYSSRLRLPLNPSKTDMVNSLHYAGMPLKLLGLAAHKLEQMLSTNTGTTQRNCTYLNTSQNNYKISMANDRKITVTKLEKPYNSTLTKISFRKNSKK